MRSLNLNEVQEIGGGPAPLVWLAGAAIVTLVAGEIAEGYNDAVHMHETDRVSDDTCSIDDDPFGG